MPSENIVLLSVGRSLEVLCQCIENGMLKVTNIYQYHIIRLKLQERTKASFKEVCPDIAHQNTSEFLYFEQCFQKCFCSIKNPFDSDNLWRQALASSVPSTLCLSVQPRCLRRQVFLEEYKTTDTWEDWGGRKVSSAGSRDWSTSFEFWRNKWYEWKIQHKL